MTAAVRVVLCTAPAAAAEGLIDALLRDGLAACVNRIGPVRSRYLWRGSIEEAEELLLLIKTRADLCPALRSRIAELHPYEVPEVIELPVEGGLEAYLQWVAGSVRPPGQGSR